MRIGGDSIIGWKLLDTLYLELENITFELISKRLTLRLFSQIISITSNQ